MPPFGKKLNDLFCLENALRLIHDFFYMTKTTLTKIISKIFLLKMLKNVSNLKLIQHKMIHLFFCQRKAQISKC